MAGVNSDDFWKQLRSKSVSEDVVDRLPSSIELPALPNAVMEFVEKSANPNYDAHVLAGIVEKDATLTVELLRYINSAAFARKSAVRCVRDAIVQMGINNAKNHLIAAGMKAASLAMKSRLINQRNFWNESLQRALFAREVARRLRLDSGLAFLGGLLQDYLLPVLTNHFDDQYIVFLQEHAPQGRELVSWERETFGWDHAVAGASVAVRWQFPDDLLCAISYHHSLQEIFSGNSNHLFNLFPVALAGMLPDQLKQVPDGLAQIIRVDDERGALKIDEVCQAVDEQQLEMADGYDIPNHLTNLLQEARNVSGQAVAAG